MPCCWFQMKPQTLEWCPSAGTVFRNEIILPVPPQQVFDEYFADINAWPRWFGSEFQSAEWVTGEGGVGSERIAYLKSITVSERFIAWDRPAEPNAPGRFAFTMTKANMPLATEGIEDYLLTPVDGGKTKFNWNVYVNLKWYMKPFGFAIRWKFGRLFRAALRSMERHADTHSKSKYV